MTICTGALAIALHLWPVNIRRFARFNNSGPWLRDRVKEVLALHYAMPWPNRELDSAPVPPLAAV